MPQRDPSHIADIHQAAKQIQLFLEGVDKEQFDGSSLIQSAVIRQIEIIGEAVKRLSPSFRAAHTDIPWRQMAGMRDLLIHAYDHVDIDEVWNAAQSDIPAIISRIAPLIQEDE